jgi:cephalosporin hydroxylase
MGAAEHSQADREPAALSVTWCVVEQIPAEIDAFTEWIQSHGRLDVVLEIGVRRGGTSAHWCGLARTRVVGVDWTGKDSLGVAGTQQVADDLQHRFPQYRFVCGDSHDPQTVRWVERALDGHPVDLLFIDGDHSYIGVGKDYQMYQHLVRPGGVIAFHDIVDTAFMRRFGHGVYRLWAELTGEKREFCVRGEWGGIGALVRA